jgi:hypothetical protein
VQPLMTNVLSSMVLFREGATSTSSESQSSAALRVARVPPSAELDCAFGAFATAPKARSSTAEGGARSPLRGDLVPPEGRHAHSPSGCARTSLRDVRERAEGAF